VTHPHARNGDYAHEGTRAVIAYSPRSAAAVSSLSVRTVMAAIASGELRSVKKGRRRIIFAADLEAFLRSDK
jgi:excisionase family DNA binding protein